MLKEYVEDHHYARFDTRSYHRFRETHFNARFDKNNATLDIKSKQSHSSVKSRLRAPCHSVCFKSMSRTITARFDTRSYHCFRETHLNARLDVNQ